MRVCGVELKGGEAIICVLDFDKGLYKVPDCRQRLFAVSDSARTASIVDFHAKFTQLMGDYHVDHVVIVARDQKGKFAGSATSFKLEAAIQLIDKPVSLISQQEIKEQMKRNPLSVDFESLGLKQFQMPAFKAAYASHNL